MNHPVLRRTGNIRNPPAVRRPLRNASLNRDRTHRNRHRLIMIHDIDFPAAVMSGYKCNLRTVRRPDRTFISVPTLWASSLRMTIDVSDEIIKGIKRLEMDALLVLGGDDFLAAGHHLFPVLAIARTVHLSPKTVETYRSRLMKKLGVHDMAALIKIAIKKGLAGAD